jgi:O-antigen/teichoic acid export membrane protein
MKHEKIIESASWLLVSHILSRGTLMLSAIILARKFEPLLFAQYSYFQITVTTLGSFASMGLGISSSKFFAENNNRDTTPPLGLLWLISIVMGLLAALIAYVWQVNTVDIALTIEPAWLAIGVFITTIGIVPAGGIIGLEKYKSAVMVSICSCIGMLYIVNIAIEGNSLILAIAALLFAQTIQVVGESIIAIKAVGWGRIKSTMKFNFYMISSVYKFAGPMMLVSVLASGGIWLLGRMIIWEDQSLVSFATFSIGMQWYALAMILPGTISKVILPKLIKSSRPLEVSDGSRLLTRDFAIISTMISVIIALAGIGLTPYLNLLYGYKYQLTYAFAAGYFVAAILSAPSNIIGNAIVAANRQFAWLMLTVAWVLTILILGFLLDLRGILGGAIALGGAAVVLSGSAFIFAKVKRLI